MILVVQQKAERLHINRAWKQYPRLETIEALFGKRTLKNRYEVALFYEFPEDGDPKDCGREGEFPSSHRHRTECCYDDDHVEWLREEARELGLDFLGTIHSHIGLNTYSHFSDDDIAAHIDHGEMISAVTFLFIHKRHRQAEVRYGCPWQPVQVHYI